MKKFFTYLLTLIILGLNTMPALAAEQKVFKSMASKNKKADNNYKFNYVNTDWWESFNDAVLSSYIEKAVLNNYDLKMASLAVDEYYQNVKLQLSHEMPAASTGFNPAWLKAPMMETGWSFAVPAIAQYEADIFLKNRDKTRAVKKMYEASQFDERTAYIAIASAVGTTYLNILKLDKIIEIQEQIAASRKTIYDLMLLRNKEGLTSTADTLRANKAHAAGSADLLELKKQRDRLLNQLAVLIGENPEDAAKLSRNSLDSISFLNNIPKEISSEIIVQRPDYLKAEKMVEKAGIDVRVAKKEFLPDISLTGLALFNSNNFGSIFTTSNMITAFAAGATLPIFTGGARIAALKLKKHTYERVLQDYYKTNLTAIQEVNDALAAVNFDNEKMLLTDKQLQLEKNEYRYNQQRYRQGVISRLDLIQNEENLLAMNKLAAMQKVECFVDYIELYKAAGAKL